MMACVASAAWWVVVVAGLAATCGGFAPCTAARGAGYPSVGSVLGEDVRYEPVPGWPLGLPANATRFTAVALQGRQVFIAQRGLAFPEPVMVFDLASGKLLDAWGSKHVAHTRDGGWGVHGMNIHQQEAEDGAHGVVWITDVLDHTVKTFHTNGTLISTIGTAGQQGSGTKPLQFGNVADVAFETVFGQPLAFVSDGDGGINDRVMAINTTDMSLVWIKGKLGQDPLQFNSPHTIMFHPPSGTVLVGDRGNNRTQQLARNGTFLDKWTCMRPGTVWGLRWVPLLNAIALADGDSQTLTLYDAEQVSSGSLGACRVLQQLNIGRSSCNTPHELAVDPHSGDIFLTCVNNPGSGFLRFTLASWP